jgi:tetratricopeptide (TPR) repeat protein
LGYLGYYFAWLAFSYLIREPRLLIGLLLLWLLRGFLPPPGALLGALGRAGRLREQVRLNRANITARRDLATIYLSLLRPRRALPLLEEGLALAPNDAELIYLYGVALHRCGRHEDALARLLSALEKDARLRHGHPYFVAGETLLALSRWDDAVDAFERYLDFNGSDVAAHTQLARAYAGSKDTAVARQWLMAGIASWHGLSGALKRRQFGAYLKAQSARVTLLREPAAMLVAASLAALVVGGGLAVYPLVAKLWQPKPAQAMLERMRQSAARCGTVKTGEFQGHYAGSVDDAESLGAGTSEERRELQRQMAELFGDVRIQKDRILMGHEPLLDLCLTRVIEQRSQFLHAEAGLFFREAATGEAADEDVAPPLDASGPVELFDVRLTRGSDATRLSYAPLDKPLSAMRVTLRRQE